MSGISTCRGIVFDSLNRKGNSVSLSSMVSTLIFVFEITLSFLLRFLARAQSLSLLRTIDDRLFGLQSLLSGSVTELNGDDEM